MGVLAWWDTSSTIGSHKARFLQQGETRIFEGFAHN